MDFKIFISLFSLFQLASCMIIKEIKPGYIGMFRYYEAESKEADERHPFWHFEFTERAPHEIGKNLVKEDLVIRTFPTKVNLFHENTEYTKNMSMELERSCGSSKSSFDKTDFAMLTLIEKDVDNVTSHIIKSITVDPLSVDFYPVELPMEKFESLVQCKVRDTDSQFCIMLCDNINGVNINGLPLWESPYFQKECPTLYSNNCTFTPKEVDYPKVLAETVKFIKTMKYLRLFGHNLSETCTFELNYWTVLELDNKTASLFPKLTENHYFIATFIDTKENQATTRKVDECRIISD